jgi:hypothetical protein
MAPNQRIVPSGSGRAQKGFVSTIYDEATNPENKTIVRSLLIFGVRFDSIGIASGHQKN